jgi:hypothetical protein
VPCRRGYEVILRSLLTIIAADPFGRGFARLHRRLN